MNCPLCQTAMQASPLFGDVVTVAHTCPNCQHKHVVSFEKPDTQYNPFVSTIKRQLPVSLVGHTMTTRFMNTNTTRFIIGQYQNWKHETVYVLSEWNSSSKRFIEIAGNSFMYGRSTISTSAYTMPETVKAMARAYKLIGVMQSVKKSIRRAHDGVAHCTQIIAQTAYRGAFDMTDKVGYILLDKEPDFLFGNEIVKNQRVALYKKLAALMIEELQVAGIIDNQ